jgi:hypothetical protein
LFIHVHKFPIKHMCWHSITKIHRNGPRAHFPFSHGAAGRAAARAGFLEETLVVMARAWC